MKKILKYIQLAVALFVLCICTQALAAADYVWTYQYNGLAQFEKNGKIGLINRDGNIVCDAKYDGMSYFDKYGYAKVYTYASDGYEIDYIGIIDESGKQILPFMKENYVLYREFAPEGEGGFFTAGKDYFCGFISTEGQLLNKERWLAENRGGDAGIGFVTKDRETWYLLDKYGQQATDYTFYKVQEAESYLESGGHEGYAKTESGYIIVNDKGNIVKEYEEQDDGSNKLIAYYDEAGKPRDLKDYDDWVYQRYCNMFKIRKGEKWGAASADGSVRVEANYDELDILDLDDKVYFLVKRGGKVALFDRDGNVLMPLEWEKITPKGDCIIVSRNDKTGVALAGGDLIVEPVWDEVNILAGIGFLVERNQMIGLLSEEGQTILEPLYSVIYTWVMGDDGARTLYVEDNEGNAKIVSISGQELEQVEGTYIREDFTRDRTLEIYQQKNKEKEAVSWFLMNAETGKIIEEYDAKEFTLLYADDFETFDFFDKQNYLSTIEYKGELGFLRPDGQIVTNADWGLILDFNPNQLLFVETKDGKYGLVDPSGNYIAKPVWDNAIVDIMAGHIFIDMGDKQYAEVGLRDENEVMRFGYIDEQGQPICGLKQPTQ